MKDLAPASQLVEGLLVRRLAGLIKARAPEQPVVLVTAHAETMLNTETARLERVDAMLSKPFSQEQLHDTLRVVFPAG